MKKMFWFKSSRKADKCNNLMICTDNKRKAMAMAQIYFLKKSFKGVPNFLF